MAARLVAERQPVKLAAIEGLWQTQPRAPLTIGGIPLPSQERTVLGIQIPGGLSWLAFGDADAVVTGLDSVPPDERPNTIVVHLAFQLMVGIGFALAGLGLWAAVSWIRRRSCRMVVGSFGPSRSQVPPPSSPSSPDGW